MASSWTRRAAGVAMGFLVMLPKTYHVRGVVLEDKSGLSLRQIQDHLSEVTVGPSELGPCVVTRVVDVDALVYEAQAKGIVKDDGQAVLDLSVVVCTKDT